MHPAGANPNGTYTYAFVMDPLIKKADYDIESLIKKKYGAKQGADYYKLFDILCMKRPAQRAVGVLDWGGLRVANATPSIAAG